MKKISSAIALTLLVLIGILPVTTRADDKPKTPAKKVFKFKEDGQLAKEDWQVDLLAHRAGIAFTEDGLSLANRTYIWSTRPFEKGTISLKWEWVDRTDSPENAVLYADYLTVVLRSTGKVSEKRSWEHQDGIRVRVEAGPGRVSIESVDGGATKHLVEPKSLARGEGALALNNNTPHTVVVKDDGKKIYVTVNDQKDFLVASYDAKKFPGKVWGVSNREAVGFPHILKIAELSVEP